MQRPMPVALRLRLRLAGSETGDGGLGEGVVYLGRHR
jgi:hypothetical protein